MGTFALLGWCFLRLGSLSVREEGLLLFLTALQEFGAVYCLAEYLVGWPILIVCGHRKVDDSSDLERGRRVCTCQELLVALHDLAIVELEGNLSLLSRCSTLFKTCSNLRLLFAVGPQEGLFGLPLLLVRGRLFEDGLDAPAFNKVCGMMPLLYVQKIHIQVPVVFLSR